jgi:hypothetical protein
MGKVGVKVQTDYNTAAPLKWGTSAFSVGLKPPGLRDEGN